MSFVGLENDAFVRRRFKISHDSLCSYFVRVLRIVAESSTLMNGVGVGESFAFGWSLQPARHARYSVLVLVHYAPYSLHAWVRDSIEC